MDKYLSVCSCICEMKEKFAKCECPDCKCEVYDDHRVTVDGKEFCSEAVRAVTLRVQAVVKTAANVKVSGGLFCDKTKPSSYRKINGLRPGGNRLKLKPVMDHAAFSDRSPQCL